MTDYRIRLAHFLPRDRRPVANFEAKIGVLMHFVAEFYHQDLKNRGVPVKELAFETRGGAPLIHVIRGDKPATFYNDAPAYDSGQQFGRITNEIPTDVGVPDKHLIIVFADTYDDGPTEAEWGGRIARGRRDSKAGGLAIMSAWILRDEFCTSSVSSQRELMFDTTPINGRTAVGYGKPDSPRYQFVEDGFGAVCHELGHTLGLPHDTRDRREVMGQGFRHIRWNFGDPSEPEKGCTFSDDSARILLSSRYLGADLDPTDVSPPEVRARIVNVQLDKHPASVTVEVDASDDQGLRAAILYALHQDSTIGGRWLRDKRQLFTQQLVIAPPKSNEIQIDVSITDVGGNYTTKQVSWTGPHR